MNTPPQFVKQTQPANRSRPSKHKFSNKWNILEQAEAALNERAAEIATLNSDREARLKAFDEETGTIGERLATARKEREELFANLPKPMSGLYSRIGARIRDGVAVAEARNRSCTACFMSLQAAGDV